MGMLSGMAVLRLKPMYYRQTWDQLWKSISTDPVLAPAFMVGYNGGLDVKTAVLRIVTNEFSYDGLSAADKATLQGYYNTMRWPEFWDAVYQHPTIAPVLAAQEEGRPALVAFNSQLASLGFATAPTAPAAVAAAGAVTPAASTLGTITAVAQTAGAVATAAAPVLSTVRTGINTVANIVPSGSGVSDTLGSISGVIGSVVKMLGGTAAQPTNPTVTAQLVTNPQPAPAAAPAGLPVAALVMLGLAAYLVFGD